MKLKKYLENFDNYLNEVSVTGGTGTFVGSAGDIIDQKFAGAFHPKFGDIEKLLNQQVDGDIARRMYTDDNTPPTDEDFIDMEYEYNYDEFEKSDKSKFINNSITDMKSINMDIVYDDTPIYSGDKFINKSTSDMQYIEKEDFIKMSDKNMKVSNINITYEDDEEEFLEDRNSSIYAGDNFINKSATNWKYIK